ncbi:MAG: hypothetical protein ACOYL6_09315 [Bacteriovoracaceae bacterium]
MKELFLVFFALFSIKAFSQYKFDYEVNYEYWSERYVTKFYADRIDLAHGLDSTAYWKVKISAIVEYDTSGKATVLSSEVIFYKPRFKELESIDTGLGVYKTHRFEKAYDFAESMEIEMKAEVLKNGEIRLIPKIIKSEQLRKEFIEIGHLQVSKDFSQVSAVNKFNSMCDRWVKSPAITFGALKNIVNFFK